MACHGKAVLMPMTETLLHKKNQAGGNILADFAASMIIYECDRLHAGGMKGRQRADFEPQCQTALE